MISKVKSAKVVLITKGKRTKACLFTIPDKPMQEKALDMAYKIRGKYKEDNEDRNKDARLDAAIDRISAILPQASN